MDLSKMKTQIQAAAKMVWLVVICQSAAAVAQTYTAQNSPASPAQFKAIIQARLGKNHVIGVSSTTYEVLTTCAGEEQQ
jgi:N-acetylneuraminic acid mutarotase